MRNKIIFAAAFFLSLQYQLQLSHAIDLFLHFLRNSSLQMHLAISPLQMQLIYICKCILRPFCNVALQSAPASAFHSPILEFRFATILKLHSFTRIWNVFSHKFSAICICGCALQIYAITFGNVLFHRFTSSNARNNSFAIAIQLFE